MKNLVVISSRCLKKGEFDVTDKERSGRPEVYKGKVLCTSKSTTTTQQRRNYEDLIVMWLMSCSWWNQLRDVNYELLKPKLGLSIKHNYRNCAEHSRRTRPLLYNLVLSGHDKIILQ